MMRSTPLFWALLVGCGSSASPSLGIDTVADITPSDVATTGDLASDVAAALELPGDAKVDAPAQPDPYPKDDLLRVNQLQCRGTHNSYHVAPAKEIRIPEWDYTNLPLAEQLDLGARNFEIDVYREGETLLVAHLPGLDDVSNCPDLETCFGEIAGWSDKNPGHHPLFVMIEMKSTNDIADWIDLFETAVVESLGKARVITPDEVRGTAVNLRDAVTSTGWPTLGQTRGRVFVIVMEDADLYEAWKDGHPAGAGRSVFLHLPSSSLDAAFVKHDDPVSDADAIADAVASGFIVRTRADSIPGDEGPDGKHNSVQALASGAQLISSDRLQPRHGKPYQFVIPDGTPSRCNPANAPAECTSDAIESPERLPPASPL